MPYSDSILEIYFNWKQPVCFLSKGFEVCILKALLKIRNPHSPIIMNDLFDNETKDELLSFQQRNEGFKPQKGTFSATDPILELQCAEGLKPNGMFDRLTFEALMVGLPPLLIRDYSITLIPQKTLHTCWVAATSMMTGEDWDDIIKKTPDKSWIKRLPWNEGGFIEYNRLRWVKDELRLKTEAPFDGDKYAIDFARIHGFRLHTWDWNVDFLCAAIAKGPLLFSNSFVRKITKEDKGEYEEGKDKSLNHAIVISGVISNYNQSGTFLRIHDPSPRSIGSIHWEDYDWLLTKRPSSLAFFFSRPSDF